MFSFKPLVKTSRTFAAIEEVKTGDIKEVLYFSDESREDPLPKEAQEEFTTTFQQYQNPDETLKSQYQYKILPNSEVMDGFERDVIYCAGKAGSGKTWQISNYILNYHKFFPNNKIVFISINDIKTDKSLEKVMGLTRETGVDQKTGAILTETVVKQINLLSVDSEIDPKDHQNTLFLFDDIMDIKPSFSAKDIIPLLTPEEQKKFIKAGGMTLKERDAMESYTLKKMKRAVGYIRGSILKLIDAGRKKEISIIVVDHRLNSGPYTAELIQKCQTFWLFPYSNNSAKSLKYWLEKVSFDSDEANVVAKIRYFKFDFLYINKEGLKFIMTPDRLIMFNMK